MGEVIFMFYNDIFVAFVFVFCCLCRFFFLVLCVARFLGRMCLLSIVYCVAERRIPQRLI